MEFDLKCSFRKWILIQYPRVILYYIQNISVLNKINYTYLEQESSQYLSYDINIIYERDIELKSRNILLPD